MLDGKLMQNQTAGGLAIGAAVGTLGLVIG
jgi:hypothetical protein